MQDTSRPLVQRFIGCPPRGVLAAFSPANKQNGRIDTQVRQSVNFSNVQNFTINATTYDQDITQGTQVQSLTTTRQGPVLYETLESFRYPLTMIST
jgi:hypothetical protein